VNLFKYAHATTATKKIDSVEFLDFGYDAKTNKMRLVFESLDGEKLYRLNMSEEETLEICRELSAWYKEWESKDDCISCINYRRDGHSNTGA
jgi:hypothetical protein